MISNSDSPKIHGQNHFIAEVHGFGDISRWFTNTKDFWIHFYKNIKLPYAVDANRLRVVKFKSY